MAADSRSALLCASLSADTSAGETGSTTAAALHEGLVRPAVEDFGGQIAGIAGDSLVVEFPDGMSALHSALALGRAAIEPAAPLAVSVGIDIPTEAGNADLALRLQQLAEGEIIVSGSVHDEVAGDVEAELVDLGRHPVLNSDKVALYRVRDAAPSTAGTSPSGPVRKAAYVVVPLASLGFTSLAVSALRRPDAATPPEPGSDLCPLCGSAHEEPPEAAAPAEVPELDPEPEFVIVGGTPEQREMAEFAQDRFAEYGLALPDVTISFHDHEDRDEFCGGNVAIAKHGGEAAEIEMCGNAMPLMMHELTHIWAGAHLTADVRAAFLDLRGLDTWAGGDALWGMRGSEHAANVIAWGLQDDPVRPSGTLPNDGDSLAEAFRLLTGGKTPASLREPGEPAGEDFVLLRAAEEAAGETDAAEEAAASEPVAWDDDETPAWAAFAAEDQVALDDLDEGNDEAPVEDSEEPADVLPD